MVGEGCHVGLDGFVEEPFAFLHEKSFGVEHGILDGEGVDDVRVVDVDGKSHVGVCNEVSALCVIVGKAVDLVVGAQDLNRLTKFFNYQRHDTTVRTVGIDFEVGVFGKFCDDFQEDTG